MSHTYVAYKREDEMRVARLVRALETVGLEIWFDQLLPGAEEWRRHLDEKLGGAGCVLVVWSKASATTVNHWVNHEASVGLGRDILVPVRINRVRPPPPFGEIQSVDLWHWKGDVRDPVFGDLVAAIEAKLSGLPVPRPLGKIARLRRRAAYWSLSSAGLTAAGMLLFNTFGAASQVCTIGGMQPALSDLCGTLHLGGRPSREERLAWTSRPEGDCEALAAHVRHFPQGAYAQEASNLLIAKRVRTVEVLSPAATTLPEVELTDGPASPTETEARTSALMRAKPKAEDLCRNMAVSGNLFRFVSAQAVPRNWTCDHVSNGVICGFHGSAQCTLQNRQLVETAWCGE